MEKLHKFGFALALVASSSLANAQSNLASQMQGQHESRVRVGLVVPFGSAGNQAERAPRLEAWSEHQRHGNTDMSWMSGDRRGKAVPLRLGITLDGQSQMMLNGRELPQQSSKQGVSTVGWIAIGVGVAVLAFGVVLIDHVNNTS